MIRAEDGRFNCEPAMREVSPRRWLAYTVAMRETLRDVLGVEPPQPDLSLVFGELALALRDAAPPGVEEPSMVLLGATPRRPRA